GDTIVSSSMPDMDELRRMPAPTPAAGVAPGGVTLTQAASPVAMATGPRTLPPRLPTPPPLPPVVLPTGMPYEPAPSDLSRTAVAESHLVFPQPLLRPSLSNEYSAPAAHPAMMGMPGHGPPDMQRLFAPPARSEQRTITAQSLRRGVPVWAVAIGSAFIGLLAFGLVVALLSRSFSHGSSSTDPSARAATSTTSAPTAPPSAPKAIPAATPAPHVGPFAAARAAFVSTLGAATLPAPTNNAVAPPPPSAAPAPSAAPLAPSETAQAIPTTNIASLPTMPVAHAVPAVAPHPAPVVATPPSTAGAGSGTLKVICFPGCDQIIDNGSPLGPSPIIRRTASVGSHRIKLVWSDASKVVSTVVIADQTATVRENHP
ncbi:MAG TPA: hypothetical protein VIJ22_01780, partial [Polyangiaceae bacterium]